MEITSFGNTRQSGILHKCDSLIVRDALASDFIMPCNLTRCPGCRTQAELLCPQCIYSHYINIHKLKERYKKRLHEKSNLCDSIRKEIFSQMNIQADIRRLQKSIAEKRVLLAKKRDRISRINGHINVVSLNLPKAAQNVETLDKKIKMHLLRISSATEENLKQKEEALSLETKLFAERLTLVGGLTKLFPLEEIEKMSGSFAEELRIQNQLEEASSSDIRKWDARRITNPSKRQSTKFFKIRNCEISDNCEYNLLGNELGTGSLILTNRSAHAFAAFIYLCHFVNILATIFDIILPYKITLHELCAYDKWTKELFETDVFKVNANVLQLCCSLGISSNETEFKRPFANILKLLSVLQRRPCQKMPVTFFLEKHSETIRNALLEIRWEERRQELDLVSLEDDWVKID
uniref:Uncharacterized protein n=1 Tax=Acrobeloides nanus TaxID=290746 RepID=A0A914DPU6_9BILA